MKTAPQISLTKEELATRTLWSRLIEPARLALRAKVLLSAADGRPNKEIPTENDSLSTALRMTFQRTFQFSRPLPFRGLHFLPATV